MKSKTIITDELGNLDTKRFILFMVGLGLISYLSGINWFTSDFKESARKYVLEINKNCPIENPSNVFLDSASYDGERTMTQYFSVNFKEMDQNEIENMKKLMNEHMKSKLASNQKTVELLMKQDFVLVFKVVDRNNNVQSFQYSIDKKLLSEHTDNLN